MVQQPADILCVNVMKQTVYENEVERALLASGVFSDVSNDEAAAEAPAGVDDVIGIDVDAEVIGRGEIRSVRSRSAANVQDARCSTDITPAENWLEFFLDKGPLPSSIDNGVLEELCCTCS